MVNVLDKVQPKNKEQLKQLINYAFKHNIYNLNFIDISKITDMSELFRNVEHDFDVSSWDVSNVTNMEFMFYKCSMFTGKGLENWDVSNVPDMTCMFNGCKNFNCDLSNWDVSNVMSMYALFRKCNKFTGKGLENWNVSNVTDMTSMFAECEKFDCDLSNLDVSKVEDMRYMFYSCKNFKGKGLENWDVSKVKDMNYMFNNCNKTSIPNWYKLYRRK